MIDLKSISWKFNKLVRSLDSPKVYGLKELSKIAGAEEKIEFIVKI